MGRKVLLAVVLPLATAGLTGAADADRRCRVQIGRRVEQAVAATLRSPTPNPTPAQTTRFLDRLQASCAGAAATLAAYPAASLAPALGELVASEAAAVASTLGPPPAGLARAGGRCRRTIAKSRLALITTLFRNAVGCQRRRDPDATGALADACLPDAGALGARLRTRIAHACAASDSVAAGTCAPLPGCVVTRAETAARALAAAAFGGVVGTMPRFELGGDLLLSDQFWNFPWPSDLRLRADGAPELAGFPVAPGNGLVASIKSVADRRPAFPAVPVAYVRFSDALAPQVLTDVFPASIGSPVLLVDVDPTSPARGRLYPTIAQSLPTDAYVPEHLLAIAPSTGTVLPAGRIYAVVVRRALGDAAGQPLGVPMSFLQLRAGGTPFGVLGEAAPRVYAPLWETLSLLGVARDEIAVATVFTVGDVVQDFADLADALAERHVLSIEDLVLDETHARFCELRGRIRYPQFQRGVPPFDTQGDFELGPDELPIVQREESAPVVITLPRQPMPQVGYPLVQFFHGSGGYAAQVVDRGPVLGAGGTPVVGQGPAYVLAAHGIATVGSALLLNPERLPGATPRAYLNFANLAAYPSTFRQGTIEQRLLLDALSRLEIPPDLLVGCDGPTAGGGPLRLRTEVIGLQGQSLGGQYTNYFGAIEPRAGAVVPTGSGGLWALTILEATLVDGQDTRPLIPGLIGAATPLTYLHPALALLETAWEWGETLVYAPRLADNPLPGHPARDLYQPISPDDPGFPDPIYAAMAVASGTQQAGDRLTPLLPAALALAGREALATYPVSVNRAAADGQSFTGVVAQYYADAILDGHHIFAQRDEVKYQYGCFFGSFFATGTAVVPAPAALGTPCP